jgi:ArsR family transcriptional regulator
MLELFAPSASSALGIDRSPEMLRLARAKLAAAGLEQVELRQGDIYALNLQDGIADTVLLHQVLHYAQQPEAALIEAARLLSPGGRLLVADFAPHEREDLRSRHAHARLGFSGELTVKLWLGRKFSRNGIAAG